MSDATRDDRLISGAVIGGPLWFYVGVPMLTTSSSLHHDRSGRTIHHDIVAMHDVRLESGRSMQDQAGRLSMFQGREKTVGVAQINAELPDHYSVWLNLYEDEFETAWQLLLAGYRLARFELEFDIEVDQNFDVSNYWDDVRYPYVDADSYRLDWVAESGGKLVGRHNMFGIKRADGGA